MFDRHYAKLQGKRLPLTLNVIIVTVLYLVITNADSTQFLKVELKDFFGALNTNMGILFFPAGIFAVIFSLFIGNIAFLGAKNFFLNRLRDPSVQIDRFIFGVSGGMSRYFNFVLFGLLKGILLFLWSLLLVVPGIVMSYGYSMASYIMSENPQIDPMKALKMSSNMTRGYKMELFVLDLSFFGWYILSALTAGILLVYVLPYRETAYAAAYEMIKANAIKDRIVFYSDFNQAPPVWQKEV